jgi:tRNA(Ile)-lysidine synthase
LNNLDLIQLQNKNNLLAFSGGVDSSALFYILVNNNISFDLAIVDYNMRKESKDEVLYAKELAQKFNKKIFIKEVRLEDTNFEANARNLRYDFFDETIEYNNYDNLITAHQLNDKMEWFLMQMTKGAGIIELFGMDFISIRKDYNIVRPLLNISKQQLEEYLINNNYKYFVDNSNFDTKYKRNFFRKNFANELVDNYSKGISRTFEYIKNDINSLDSNKILFKEKDLYILEAKNDNNINIKSIDKIIKKLGFILTKAQKDEIFRTKDLVLFHKISVVFIDKKIYISPFIKDVKMEKKFKEYCRINKIPPKIRGYIFIHDIKL